MTNPKQRIRGVSAPPPRPTLWAAALLAGALSLAVLAGYGLSRLLF